MMMREKEDRMIEMGDIRVQDSKEFNCDAESMREKNASRSHEEEPRGGLKSEIEGQDVNVLERSESEMNEGFPHRYRMRMLPVDRCFFLNSTRVASFHPSSP